MAEAGEVMPQKSTFFYPKVLTGLAIHTLDPTRAVRSREPLTPPSAAGFAESGPGAASARARCVAACSVAPIAQMACLRCSQTSSEHASQSALARRDDRRER